MGVLSMCCAVPVSKVRCASVVVKFSRVRIVVITAVLKLSGSFADTVSRSCCISSSLFEDLQLPFVTLFAFAVHRFAVCHLPPSNIEHRNVLNFDKLVEH